jgi:hypothetical protein
MNAAQLLLLCLMGCVAAASAQVHPMMAMMKLMDSLDLPDGPISSPMVVKTTSSSPLSSLLRGLPSDDGSRLMRINIPMGSNAPLGSILQDAMDCACEEAAEQAKRRQTALAATAPTFLPVGGANLLPRVSGFFGGMPASSGGRSMSMRMVRDGSGSIRKTTTTIDAEGNEETRTVTIPEGADGSDGDDAGDMISQMLFGKGSPFADLDDEETSGNDLADEDNREEVDEESPQEEDEDEDEENNVGDDDQDEDDGSDEEDDQEDADPAQDAEDSDEEEQQQQDEDGGPVEVSGEGIDDLDASSKDAILSAVSSKLNLDPKELQMVSSALEAPAAKASKADTVSALEKEVAANAEADAAVKAQEAKTLDDVRVAEGKASAEADAAKEAASEAQNHLVEQQKALERLSKLQRQLEKAQGQSVVA